MGRVVVIGGGAAGMMAAAAAADAGNRVCLVEKNEKLGKKLFLTGKGRCNVTNAADGEVFFANVCTNPKFLYRAFHGFDNRVVMEFLERAGCPLKTERGERVFPVSDHSSDVIAALQRELKKRGVEILLHTEAVGLATVGSPAGADEGEGCSKAKDTDDRDARVEGGILAARKDPDASPLVRVEGVRLRGGRVLSADSVIVCTGGLSYPATGSTGDGYRLAAETGHRIVGQVPGLVPFEVRETWCRELMGLALKNVSLRLLSGQKERYRDFGEMLFTHFGVSGPLVLSASSHYRPGEETRLLIDLKPALTEEQLDKRLLRDFEENRNRQFKNSLGGLFPVRLVPVMVAQSGICPEKRVNEVTKAERQAFVRLIKNLSLTVTGTRDFAEAIITRGGVSVKDVNPSTMESKKVAGLYFAGEVLDLDALTGGFNLQIAWSTGHLAGVSCRERTCAGSSVVGERGGTKSKNREEQEPWRDRP